MSKPPGSGSPALHARAGLGRAEAIWLLILSAAVVFAILGSLGADRNARDLREKQDELRYLAGQLSFAMSQASDAGESWPAVLVTPGTSSPELQSAESLATALGSATYLPVGPDGGAYLARRVGPRAWVLSAPGAQGEVLDLADEAALEQARRDELALDVRLP